MRFLIRVLITAGSLMIIAYLIPGIHVSGVYPAVIASVVLGILNAIVRPIIILVTLPVTILTLGLFIFVINAGMLFFVASFVDGFEVTSFVSALIGSVLLSIVSGIANKFI